MLSSLATLALFLSACGGDSSTGGGNIELSCSSIEADDSSSSLGDVNGPLSSSGLQERSSSSFAEFLSSTTPKSSSSATKSSSSSWEKSSSSIIDDRFSSTAISSSSVSSESSSSDVNSSSSSGGASGRTFTDSRDNRVYRYVEIGTQTWMAENLNYAVTSSNSWCYGEGGSVDESGEYITLSDEEIQANCKKYGRLYNWEAVMAGAASSSAIPSGVQGICPDGWHLPSNAEWIMMVDFIGGESVAGTKLKSATGWIDKGYGLIIGTDDYGFNALPGGYRFFAGYFLNVGGIGYWWSATENDSYNTYRWRMGSHYAYVSEGYPDKSNGYSVRCIKD